MTNAHSSFVNYGNTMAHVIYMESRMSYIISLGRDSNNKQGTFEENVDKPETYSLMVSPLVNLIANDVLGNSAVTAKNNLGTEMSVIVSYDCMAFLELIILLIYIESSFSVHILMKYIFVLIYNEVYNWWTVKKY